MPYSTFEQNAKNVGIALKKTTNRNIITAPKNFSPCGGCGGNKRKKQPNTENQEQNNKNNNPIDTQKKIP